MCAHEKWRHPRYGLMAAGKKFRKRDRDGNERGHTSLYINSFILVLKFCLIHSTFYNETYFI